MASHDEGCGCTTCLVAWMERVALSCEIEASWHGWDLNPTPAYMGDDPTLPRVPEMSWVGWFVNQDAPRRELILAKCEVVLEAEQLLQRLPGGTMSHQEDLSGNQPAARELASLRESTQDLYKAISKYDRPRVAGLIEQVEREWRKCNSLQISLSAAGGSGDVLVDLAAGLNEAMRARARGLSIISGIGPTRADH
jgi:hypothetical protein